MTVTNGASIRQIFDSTALYVDQTLTKNFNWRAACSHVESFRGGRLLSLFFFLLTSANPPLNECTYFSQMDFQRM